MLPIVLMGSTLSRYQGDLLVGHFDRALLMLDGDDAGRHGAVTIAETLSGRLSVSAIPLRDGQQPDNLTAGEVRNLIARYDSLKAPLIAPDTHHAH